MNPSSKALMLQTFGGPENFALVERPLPEPGPGEILVKILAASVQFTDVILRKGQYPDLKEKPPLILGYDVVGEVLKVGVGVTKVSVGQRVADLTMTGSYAQHRILQADRVTPVDPSLDPAEVAALLLGWMTSYQLLHRDAKVKKGQKILVLGAGGACGQALIVLGKIAGCEVWGSARSRHAALVKSLGATHIDSDTTDISKVLPGGFDVVFDGIGQQGFSLSWNALGPSGHLSAYGFSEGVQNNSSFLKIGLGFLKLFLWNTFGGKRSNSFYSITSLRKKHPQWFTEDVSALLGLLQRKEIKPQVAQRIGLDGVARAHNELEKGGLQGKIVILPNG